MYNRRSHLSTDFQNITLELYIRKALANGAIEVSKWLFKQPNGFYKMDDFCNQRKSS